MIRVGKSHVRPGDHTAPPPPSNCSRLCAPCSGVPFRRKTPPPPSLPNMAVAAVSPAGRPALTRGRAGGCLPYAGGRGSLADGGPALSATALWRRGREGACTAGGARVGTHPRHPASALQPAIQLPPLPVSVNPLPAPRAPPSTGTRHRQTQRAAPSAAAGAIARRQHHQRPPQPPAAPLPPPPPTAPALSSPAAHTALGRPCHHQPPTPPAAPARPRLHQQQCPACKGRPRGPLAAATSPAAAWGESAGRGSTA